MRGTTILDQDSRGCLSFDLKDVLHAIGSEVEESDWEIESIESLGEGATILQEVSAERRRISGSELMALANRVYQVIDGEFRAIRKNEAQPWLVIRAVDSSGYDVFCEAAAVHERLEESFKHVVAIPD